MNLQEIKKGIRVKTNPALGSTNGLSVNQQHIRARRTSKEGTVLGFIPGHGGDCWWIKHDSGDIGAYCYDEFEVLS